MKTSERAEEHSSVKQTSKVFILFKLTLLRTKGNCLYYGCSSLKINNAHISKSFLS